MAEQRCKMCFKAKSTGPALRGLDVEVCKGCWLDIDRVMGFLEIHSEPDATWELVPPFADGVTAPLTPQESTAEAVNGAKPVRTPAKA